MGPADFVDEQNINLYINKSNRPLCTRVRFVSAAPHQLELLELFPNNGSHTPNLDVFASLQRFSMSRLSIPGSLCALFSFVSTFCLLMNSVLSFHRFCALPRHVAQRQHLHYSSNVESANKHTSSSPIASMLFDVPTHSTESPVSDLLSITTTLQYSASVKRLIHFLLRHQ